MKFDNYKHMEEVIKNCSLRYNESLYKEIINCNFQQFMHKGNNCFEDMLTHNSYYAEKKTQETQNSLCEKNYFSLENKTRLYGTASFKQLKITNEKIEIVEFDASGMTKQTIIVDYKTNEISNIELEYYDKNTALFLFKKYNSEIDLYNNLEQFIKEYEILCDFKVKIAKDRFDKENDKIMIQMLSGDNIELFKQKFIKRKTPNFYSCVKYFIDEISIPEFFNDKNLSKVFTKVKKCEYFQY